MLTCSKGGFVIFSQTLETKKLNKHSMNNNNVTQPPSFSQKELDLIQCLAEGLSSKQTADRLGITRHTVDTHRRNLLRKTGCNNTLGLVVKCVRWKLI